MYESVFVCVFEFDGEKVALNNVIAVVIKALRDWKFKARRHKINIPNRPRRNGHRAVVLACPGPEQSASFHRVSRRDFRLGLR